MKENNKQISVLGDPLSNINVYHIREITSLMFLPCNLQFCFLSTDSETITTKKGNGEKKKGKVVE